MKLKLGDGLSLPLEVAGQTIAVLGIRGSGKTNTAGVIAEELLDQRQPVVIIDPTDAWWGLRSEYPVFIFGGPHGDLQLAETDGKTIAEFVVQEQVSLILSLRHLRKGAQRRLVTEFCEELYHLKGKPEYRSPLTVFIDEAPLFVPQKVMGEVARTVGAIEDLIARGRNSGFGVVILSQRSATLNKDVLTQADTIIAHRLPSPQDRKALAEWIEENATLEEYKTVLSSLPGLDTGEVWVWAPRFKLFRRAQIRPRHTFDSSAAPSGASGVKPPKNLAEIDLEKLKGKLSATIEKAKADDPRELRRQIAELKKEAAKKPTLIADSFKPSAPKIVEKFVLKDGQLARAEKLIEKFHDAVEKEQHATQARTLLREAICKAAKDIAAAIASTRAPQGNTQATTQRVIGAASVPPHPLPPQGRREPGRLAVPAATASRPTSGNGDESITPAKQKILNGLAFLHGVGVAPADKTQLALMVGVSPTSGGYFNSLGSLRSSGLIAYPSGGTVALTDAGAALASTDGVPSTTEELHDAIFRKLPTAKWKVVEALINIYPAAISKDDLAEQIGVSPTSGGFFNTLGSLRSLGLIDYPSPGFAAAQPVLFLE